MREWGDLILEHKKNGFADAETQFRTNEIVWVHFKRILTIAGSKFLSSTEFPCTLKWNSLSAFSLISFVDAIHHAVCEFCILRGWEKRVRNSITSGWVWDEVSIEQEPWWEGRNEVFSILVSKRAFKLSFNLLQHFLQ